jgi:hypothetical protein
MGRIIKMTSRVTALLVKYPTYRATKYKAIAHILWEELPSDLQTKETRAVLTLVAQSRLPATETISRAWRKVIELHPEWQTPNLEKRKYEQSDQVKAELRVIGSLEKR